MGTSLCFCVWVKDKKRIVLTQFESLCEAEEKQEALHTVHKSSVIFPTRVLVQFRLLSVQHNQTKKARRNLISRKS